MSSRDQREDTERYLWDGSGEPDAEILKLEKSLAEFRHSGRMPDLSAVPLSRPGFVDRLFGIVWVPRFAATAAIALAVLVGAIQLFLPANRVALRVGWDVACLEGTLRVGARQINASNSKGTLEVGQALVTDADSRATLAVADIGQVEVEPGSHIRLVQSTDNRKRIALDRGTIHAAIWAPPGEFVVDTPSAVAVDLGCVYTLQVADDGSGILRTTMGWVGFHRNGRDSFIPAGAMCPTRPGIGPGTPYFEDAPQALRDALLVLDFAPPTPRSRAEALRTVLSVVRKQDGLTLWHLLSRTHGEERAEVYDKFAALVPPPGNVTREGILRLDQPMLDAWWNALDLGDISVWRYWEQSPAPGSASPKQMFEKKKLLQKKLG